MTPNAVPSATVSRPQVEVELGPGARCRRHDDHDGELDCYGFGGVPAAEAIIAVCSSSDTLFFVSSGKPIVRLMIPRCYSTLTSA